MRTRNVMETPILAAVVVFIAALGKPEISSAYTISVDCAANPVPPPNLPYENVLCLYQWTPGGDPAHRFGEANAVLQYFPFGGQPPYFVDTLGTGKFNFVNETSPFSVWIACSDISGSFRVYLDGYLYKYIVGTLSSPGYFVQVDFKGDAEFAYVYPPLVTC